MFFAQGIWASWSPLAGWFMKPPCFDASQRPLLRNFMNPLIVYFIKPLPWGFMRPLLRSFAIPWGITRPLLRDFHSPLLGYFGKPLAWVLHEASFLGPLVAQSTHMFHPSYSSVEANLPKILFARMKWNSRLHSDLIVVNPHPYGGGGDDGTNLQWNISV